MHGADTSRQIPRRGRELVSCVKVSLDTTGGAVVLPEGLRTGAAKERCPCCAACQVGKHKEDPFWDGSALSKM